MRMMLSWCVVVTVFALDAPAQNTTGRDQKAVVDPVVVARVYRIRTGDSLGSIAKRVYGRASRWPVILKANPGLDGLGLRVGQVIKLPPAGAGRRIVAKSSEATRALQRARAAIVAAERATDDKELKKALDDAERALMEARRALWKPRTRGEATQTGRRK